MEERVTVEAQVGPVKMSAENIPVSSRQAVHDYMHELLRAVWLSMEEQNALEVRRILKKIGLTR